MIPQMQAVRSFSTDFKCYILRGPFPLRGLFVTVFYRTQNKFTEALFHNSIAFDIHI